MLVEGTPHRSRRVVSRQPVAWAMAAGVPIACTASNPGAELVLASGAGAIVENENDAVRFLLDLVEGGPSDAERGTAWITGTGAPDASAALYRDLYEEAAALPEALAPAFDA